MDRLTAILVVAGLGMFGLAFLLSGLYPYMITDGREPEADFAAVARNVSPHFKELKDQFPSAFAAAFPTAADALSDAELRAAGADEGRRAASEDAWRAAYAVALRNGRDRYVGEACWHCHSQYVRPVANEEQRFGPVQTTRHDANALQRPVLWGTRRVGPDLTHEGGLRSNDWHVAHFWDPQSTSPGSVMPRYTWYFEEGFEVRRRVDPDVAARERLAPDTSYRTSGVFRTEAEARQALDRVAASLPPDREPERGRLFVAPARGLDDEGIALLAYIQWLGTWEPPPMEETP